MRWICYDSPWFYLGVAYVIFRPLKHPHTHTPTNCISKEGGQSVYYNRVDTLRYVSGQFTRSIRAGTKSTAAMRRSTTVRSTGETAAIRTGFTGSRRGVRAHGGWRLRKESRPRGEFRWRLRKVHRSPMGYDTRPSGRGGRIDHGSVQRSVFPGTPRSTRAHLLHRKRDAARKGDLIWGRCARRNRSREALRGGDLPDGSLFSLNYKVCER